MSEALRVLVIHGPNLNLLGTREPEIYGNVTLSEIDSQLVSIATEAHCELAVLPIESRRGVDRSDSRGPGMGARNSGESRWVDAFERFPARCSSGYEAARGRGAPFEHSGARVISQGVGDFRYRIGGRLRFRTGELPPRPIGFAGPATEKLTG